jgi:hypothetical protein
MKLEKSDRIISNADYEKLVGLAELHEMAIQEVVTELFFEKAKDIEEYLQHMKKWTDGIIQTNKKLIEIAESGNERNRKWSGLYDEMVTLKNGIIQRKNAEIARLKKRWWKIF